MKLKLIDYDEHEVVYTYMGLNLVGEHTVDYNWRFKFPESTTAGLNMDLYAPIRFSSEVFDREDFHNDIRNELQEEVDKQLKDNENAKIIVQLLFGEALVLN